MQSPEPFRIFTRKLHHLGVPYMVSGSVAGMLEKSRQLQLGQPALDCGASASAAPLWADAWVRPIRHASPPPSGLRRTGLCVRPGWVLQP